jgi:group I intron endonuclease
MTDAGIYKITSFINGKIYIGESSGITRRFIRHKNDLKYNQHCNPFLQRHVNKYGLNDLSFEVIEKLPLDDKILFEREIYWIAFYKASNPEFGFNLNDGGVGGYITNIKHKDFVLININDGVQHTFKTVNEFEEFVGTFDSHIREILANR